VPLTVILAHRQIEAGPGLRGEYAEIRVCVEDVPEPPVGTLIVLDGETWEHRAGPLDQIVRRTVDGLWILRVQKNLRPTGR